MLAYDVFADDGFTVAEVREAANNIVYIPQTLNQMGIYVPDPIRTTDVMITRRGEALVLVPTTERGAPRTRPERDRRNIRRLSTISLRQEDRINAGELQNIVREGIPFDVAFDSAWDEVENRQRKLIRKLELTREYHRLAGLNGYVLDADGSVIYDIYAEFGFVRPAAVLIDPRLVGGAFRRQIHQLVTRPMTRQLAVAGRGAPTSIAALCGDEFYDQLITAPEIRETYLNTQQAADLRDGFQIWDEFRFGGVRWMNYRGTNDNATIKIADNQCRFFPIGAEDTFVEYRAPGENWDEQNQPGEEFYSYVVPDPRSAVSEVMMFVDILLDAHPLYLCQAPEALLTGQLAP